MIWTANNDSKGCDGNAPYAYSLGIQSMLNKNYTKKILGTNIDKNHFLAPNNFFLIFLEPLLIGYGPNFGYFGGFGGFLGGSGGGSKMTFF